MLRYLTKGERAYGTRDIHPLDHCRNNWELMVLEQGHLRMLSPGVATAGFRERSLWLLPPESQHCWESPKSRPCVIRIFHFASIHPLLEQSLPAGRKLTVKIDDREIEEIAAIYTYVEAHYHEPRPTSGIAFEIAMLRLSELILRQDRTLGQVTGFDPDAERVLHALQWHREHMGEGVNVNAVAKAMHISPPHLRRLFLRVRGESPSDSFARTKLEEACRLMSATHLNMKQIAVHCGFRGFSEFYRFFRHRTGVSPTDWKTNKAYGNLSWQNTAAARRSA